MDSTANLSLYPNSADVAEQFGLHHLSPSPLHYTAIQGELKTHTHNYCHQYPLGDRSRLKMLAREMDDVDVTDNAGNTPLIYTVMGRQTKLLW